MEEEGVFGEDEREPEYGEYGGGDGWGGEGSDNEGNGEEEAEADRIEMVAIDNAADPLVIEKVCHSITFWWQ
jgi:hypothetical protein